MEIKHIEGLKTQTPPRTMQVHAYSQLKNYRN